MLYLLSSLLFIQTALSCSMRPQDEGVCPEVKIGAVGICAEMCSDDTDCDGGLMCCSNGCGHTCQKAVSEKDNQFCKKSPAQLCRMKCQSPPECADDECVMRQGSCCNMKCQKRNDGASQFCPKSPVQYCRKKCQNPECGEDECIMREGNCCNLSCKKKEDAVEKPKMCESSPAPSCPPTMVLPCGDKGKGVCGKYPTCKENQCITETEGECCKLTCKDMDDKPKQCEGFSWDPKLCRSDDDCGSDEMCNPESCVSSQCNCSIQNGKEMVICTSDCNNQCEPKKKCDFLCDNEKPTFDDVKEACGKITDLDQCKSTGCGKKLKKNGKCVAPKKAGKIKCKNIKDMSICEKFQCKTKKKGTQCAGKSGL